ncbi:AaceriAFR259Wp [[Ashbya] aceris (nom. inval.)]|nr:AaceriAFR259Wp [[Ashbya] aceris (nom. inval.)]
MGGFELTVLGSCGGPWESGTQSFMLKPRGSTDYGYVCVDAGSGLKQLIELAAAAGPNAEVESYYKRDFEPVAAYHSEGATASTGLGTLSARTAEHFSTELVAVQRGVALYHEIGEVFVTHPHLDHVIALALNSPMARTREKRVLGLPFTIQALREHIFNDRVWPDLLGPQDPVFELEALAPAKPHVSSIVPHWTITAFPVSHGVTVREHEAFYSTGFLFRDVNDGGMLLIFGDLESDRCSGKDHLARIWAHLARTGPLEQLRGIVIECSTADLEDETYLYGHMSPQHIIYELQQLRQAYNRPLDGLSVIITHTKMECIEEDPRLLILRDLRQKSAEAKLGNIDFSVAVRGYTHFM